MDIRLVAVLLLSARIASVIFCVLVMIRQYKLFKTHIQPDLVNFRRILFALTAIITLGNIVPVVVDAGTALDLITRSSSRINPIGVVYASSNALTAMLSALMIWLLYRMARRVLIVQGPAKK